jgi:cGMP-dependent protein kinase
VGEHFAQYAKSTLPKLISKHIQHERIQAHKAKNENLAKNEQVPFNPKLFPMLEPKQYELASKRAHMECNQSMIDTQPLVNLSGTTVIGAAFHNGHIIISNVGDSRAILGYRNDMDGKIVAVPLSQDQTPWRKDERERIMKAGGRVLTIDQMEGKTSADINDRDQDRKLGEDNFIDEKGDPPRVWLNDKNIPGTSFTRSLGDSIADTVGVFAEPEFFSKPITDQDEILVLASDGVFEFLQNQEIIDVCVQYRSNPVEACEQVVDKAYKKWLDYENRTDDITVIILYLRHTNKDEQNDGIIESDMDTKELGNGHAWSLKNALLGTIF